LIVKETTTYNYITTAGDLELLLLDLEEYKKYFAKKMLLAVDCETYWTDPQYKEEVAEYKRNPIPMFVPTWDGKCEAQARILAIGLDPKLINRQYLIDIDKVGADAVRQRLKHVLEKESILIFHNAKYDLGPIAYEWDMWPESVRCTQLIAQRLNTGDKVLLDGEKSSYTLSALYERYIDFGLFIELTKSDENPNGLNFQEYEAFKKAKQKSDWDAPVLDKDQLQYSADDVRLIFYMYHSLIEACDKFIEKHPKSGLANTIKIECDCAIEYAGMEYRGIGADADYLKNGLIVYLERKAEEALNELVKIPELWVVKSKKAGGKTNPHTIEWCQPIGTGCPERGADGKGSPSLQSPALAECIQKLGFKLTKKTDKGKLSTDKEVVNELFWESPAGYARDSLEKILQVRTANGYLSRYGEKFLTMIHSDGRWHPSAFQCGDMNDAIETGRNSFKDPPFQTIPSKSVMFSELLVETILKAWFENYIKNCEAKGEKPQADAYTIFRRMVKAREGYVLVDRDFSNQEVRLIGTFSGDRKIIQAFKEKKDLHQITADNIGVDRSTGKLFFLSTQYGAKELKVQRSLYMDSGGKTFLEIEGPDGVRELRKKHFGFYSGLADFIKKGEEHVRKQLAPFNSLIEFRHRKAMMYGFAPYFGCHRGWFLTPDLEEDVARWVKRCKEAKELGDDIPPDPFHRDYRIKQPDGRWSTWNNKFNKRQSEIIREYVNYLIQATAALVLKVAVRAIGKEFRAAGFDPRTEGIILCVHDELLAEVKKEHAEQAAEIMERCMNKAMDDVMQGVIPSEASGGCAETWNEAA
jgi:DNA polymerase I-like protein with 3'-5' exonuclease and polymerase domains